MTMVRRWPIIATLLTALAAPAACTTLLGDFKIVPREAGVEITPVDEAGPPDSSITLPPGSCSPGAGRCDARKVPEFCSADGTWARESESACEYDCVAGVCVGNCHPQETMCDGENFYSECGDDATLHKVVLPGATTPRPCSYLCTSHGCSVCKPDDKRCVADELQTCSREGAWVRPPAPCAGICSGVGMLTGCMGTCKPGTRRCGATNQPQSCVNGEWVDNGVCMNNCMGAGECGGLCVNGSKKCVDRIPQNCVNGAWVASPQCDFGCTDAVGCTGRCIPGEQQCFDNTIRTCDGTGEYGPPQPCASVCAVLGDGGGRVGCTGDCAPGSFRCNGQNQEYCSDKGKWTLARTCTLGCFMNDCGVCTPGTKQCSTTSNLPQICDATGHFVNNGSCAKGCLDGGTCVP